jgi:predicted GNAT family acetyltransferase
MIVREDNGKKGRFLLKEDGVLLGEMTYTWAGKSKFIIDHTEVDERLAGKGYGRQLVMKAVVFARTKGLKILPLCPFAKKLFDMDKSIGDVRF